MRFAVNTYSIIGDGLDKTVELYKEVVRVVHRTPDVDVSIWPFYEGRC